jgi:hypothetical protein
MVRASRASFVLGFLAAVAVLFAGILTHRSTEGYSGFVILVAVFLGLTFRYRSDPIYARQQEHEDRLIAGTEEE